MSDNNYIESLGDNNFTSKNTPNGNSQEILIPTPDEVIKKLDEESKDIVDKSIKIIMGKIYEYDEKPLIINAYFTVNDKSKKFLKDIFSKREWDLEVETIHGERNAIYTSFILEKLYTAN